LYKYLESSGLASGVFRLTYCATEYNIKEGVSEPGCEGVELIQLAQHSVQQPATINMVRRGEISGFQGGEYEDDVFRADALCSLVEVY
jgi:hypothetical protein